MRYASGACPDVEDAEVWAVVGPLCEEGYELFGLGAGDERGGGGVDVYAAEVGVSGDVL